MDAAECGGAKSTKAVKGETREGKKEYKGIVEKCTMQGAACGEVAGNAGLAKAEGAKKESKQLADITIIIVILLARTGQICVVPSLRS